MEAPRLDIQADATPQKRQVEMGMLVMVVHLKRISKAHWTRAERFGGMHCNLYSGTGVRRLDNQEAGRHIPSTAKRLCLDAASSAEAKDNNSPTPSNLRQSPFSEPIRGPYLNPISSDSPAVNSGGK